MINSKSQPKTQEISLVKTEDDIIFVRSQTQLAIDNPRATGQRLTRSQTERAFGKEIIEKVIEDGVVSLVPSYHEPARTLRERRERLGFNLTQLAKSSRLDHQIVADAEIPGKIIPIQALNKLCQALALDESVLGFKPASGGDDALGVRLRTLTENQDAKSFSASTVTKLVEAAWVISKQTSLSEVLGRDMHWLVAPAHRRDQNYSYPAYEKGYLLAERTRNLLDMDDKSPIQSVRVLIEEVLNIPLIQMALDPKFAGATIANGLYRGIVINERGRNSDVAIRRMTTCHELGHLLWDSDENLNHLIVDEYEDIEGGSTQTDVVEMRANAFAVAFLAPRQAVREIVKSALTIQLAIEEISSKFGISIVAARHHVKNVCGGESAFIPMDSVDLSSWVAAENRTVDYLPGMDNSVPSSRRGMFAGIVAKAFLEKKISGDTVAMCLSTSTELTLGSAENIAQVWGLSSI